MKYLAILFQFSFVFLLQISVEASDEEKGRHHEKHIHGEGELNLVLEADELQIELHIPSMNIVGFEHQPNTKEQTEVIQKVVEQFKNVASIIILPTDAKCVVEHVEVHSLISEDHEEYGKEHHEEEHEKKYEKTHSEFEVGYHFKCQAPQNLDQVMLKLFEHFPSLEELETQFITPEKQGAQELTSNNSTIRLE